jgi:chitodextrinase
MFEGKTYAGLTGTSKQFTGLTQDTLYKYKIRANGVSGSSLFSGEKSIRTLVQPPDTPIEITAVSTSNTVTISWKAMPRATAYEVLFDGKVYPHGTTTFFKRNLTQDTEYSYQIRAKNSGGESAYSAVYTIRTKLQAPGMPTNVKARWDGDAIVVSWDPTPNATSYDIVRPDRAE